MRINNILKKPIVTEKSMAINATDNSYVFEVDKGASKGAIANEFEKSFNVEVLDVRTIIVPGKKKRIGRTAKFTKTPARKKAIIRIKGDKKLDIYAEGN